MTYFVDLNVTLDLFLPNRLNLFVSRAFFAAAAKAQVKLVLSPHLVTTGWYLMEKHADKETATLGVNFIHNRFQFAKLEREHVAAALVSEARDFEDAICIEVAKGADCDCIVIGNIKDFKTSPIEVLTPADALLRISKPSE